MFKKVFSVLLFVIMLSGMAFAMEFSADTVMTTKEGKMTGKMYFKSDRIRMDMNVKKGNMSTITRMDKKVIWNIMPAQKMYMEMPFNPQDKPKVEEKMEGEIERKQVGSENIDGHPTKKYLITYKSSKGKEQMHQWLATDINFPVKTASIDGTWTQEYKNIKIGSQANDLFEIPAGYKMMQLPAGMNFNRR